MWAITLLIFVFIFGHSIEPGPQGKTMGTLSFPTMLRRYGTGVIEAVSRVGGTIGTYFFKLFSKLLVLGTPC